MSQANQPSRDSRYPQRPQQSPFEPDPNQHGLGVPPASGEPGPHQYPAQAGGPARDQYPTQPVPIDPPPPMIGEVPVYDRPTPAAGRRNLVLAAPC